MKYAIISLNDDRLAYKEQIRQRVPLSEVSIPATDGRTVDLNEELARRQLRLGPWPLTKGEIGIWLSTFDHWKWAVDNDESLLVFEDDAIPTEQFQDFYSKYLQELPKDYDLMAVWVPDNQYLDYVYDVVYDEHGHPQHVGKNKSSITSVYNFGSTCLARVYQGYGNVAMLYSPEGAEKLLRHAQIYGLDGPVDCWIFQRAHTEIVRGYAPKPMWAKAVTYDWQAETTVHNTSRFENG